MTSGFATENRTWVAALGAMTLLLPALSVAVGRRRKWPLVSVVPAFVLGFAATACVTKVLRPDLVAAYVRLAVMLALPVEVGFVLWVVAAIFLTTRRFAGAAEAHDFHERIHAAVGGAIGDGWFSGALASEVSTLYYSLFSWRARAQVPDGAVALSYAKTAGYGGLLLGVLAALGAETGGVHLLLTRFAPRLAWFLTVFAAYGMLWLIADFRATHLRPIVAERDRLQLRAGLRWSGALPYEAIREVRCVHQAVAPAATYRSLVLFGREQAILLLREPIPLRGLFGSAARVSTVGVALDDWSHFRAALEAKGVRVLGEPGAPPTEMYERLRDTLRRFFRRGNGAAMIARELSLLAYAATFWRAGASQDSASGRAFTVHRRSGYGAVFAVLLFLSLVEMTVVHVVLRGVSAAAATALLVLGAYTIVWFIGDFSALRQRPIRVNGEALDVRVALRREVRIPLESIDRIEGLGGAAEPGRKDGYVRCTAFGSPEVLVFLRVPAVVEQMIGRNRPVSCVGLSVDDDADFRSAVTDAIARRRAALRTSPVASDEEKI